MKPSQGLCRACYGIEGARNRRVSQTQSARYAHSRVATKVMLTIDEKGQVREFVSKKGRVWKEPGNEGWTRPREVQFRSRRRRVSQSQRGENTQIEWHWAATGVPNFRFAVPSTKEPGCLVRIQDNKICRYLDLEFLVCRSSNHIFVTRRRI